MFAASISGMNKETRRFWLGWIWRMSANAVLNGAAMPRKDNSDNPLQIRVQAVSLPKRTKAEKYLRRLIQSLDSAEPLPDRWEVLIHWRNPNTSSGRSKFWQQGPFNEVLADSSAGFGLIVRAALVRQLRGAQGKR